MRPDAPAPIMITSVLILEVQSMWVIAGTLAWSLPNQQTIAINLADSMKRNIYNLTALVFELTGESVSFLEVDFPDWNSDDSPRDMIEIAYFEKT